MITTILHDFSKYPNFEDLDLDMSDFIIEVTYKISNDSIGGYDYCGANCIDHQPDYAEIENITCLDKDVMKWISKNYHAIAYNLSEQLGKDLT